MRVLRVHPKILNHPTSSAKRPNESYRKKDFSLKHDVMTGLMDKNMCSTYRFNGMKCMKFLISKVSKLVGS